MKLSIGALGNTIFEVSLSRNLNDTENIEIRSSSSRRTALKMPVPAVLRLRRQRINLHLITSRSRCRKVTWRCS